MKKLIYLLKLCLVSLFCITAVHAGLFRLRWDVNLESNLSGYKVYWATSTNHLGTTNSGVVWIPYPSQYSIDIDSTNFIANVPYYFTITAYNSISLESPFSNIIVLTNVPTTPTAPSAVKNLTGVVVSE